jgi:hypothetical protein
VGAAVEDGGEAAVSEEGDGDVAGDCCWEYSRTWR